MKSRTITFTSTIPQYNIEKPFPSSRLVPEWYRKMPGSAEKVETVKKCVPILDALTAGYMITLPVDVHFNGEDKTFWYDAPFSINSDHFYVQTQGVEIGDEFDQQPHKWINPWLIQTPKGYSCMFVHPLNRMDLPFRSFTGIVDTDKHPLAINFPFVMKKEFSGVIPAGTPIIQIIPFKRDAWSSKTIDNKPWKDHPEAFEVENPPFNWYKRKWWTRKIYT